MREQIIRVLNDKDFLVANASDICYKLYRKETNSREYRQILRELYKMRDAGIVKSFYFSSLNTTMYILTSNLIETLR